MNTVTEKESVQTTRPQALMRAYRYGKLNVFKLKKRLARANRKAIACEKVMARHSAAASVFPNGVAANKFRVASYHLRRAESVFRVALYYCGAFNIPTTATRVL